MAISTQGFQIGGRVASDYRPANPTPLNVVDGRTLVGEADTNALARGIATGQALTKGILDGLNLKEALDPVEQKKRELALAELDFGLTNKDLIEQSKLNDLKTDLALGNAQMAALAELNPFALDFQNKKLTVDEKEANANSRAKTQPLQDDLLVKELEAQLGRLPTTLELQQARDSAEKDKLATDAVVNKAQRDAVTGATQEGNATQPAEQADPELPPMPKKNYFDPLSRSFKTNPEYTKWLELKTHLEKKKIDAKIKTESTKPLTPSALKSLGGKVRVAVAARKLSDVIAKHKKNLMGEVGPFDQRYNKLKETVGISGTPEWREMMQAYADVRNTVLNELSGASVTDGEASRFLEYMGDPEKADESFLERAASAANKIEAEVQRDMDAHSQSGFKVPKSYEEVLGQSSGSQGTAKAEVPVVNSPEEAKQLPANIPTFRTPDGKLLKNPNFKPNPSTTGAVEG